MTAKKDIKELLGIDDTWFLIIGVPIIAFIIPLLFFKSTLSNGLIPYLPKFLISLMYTVTYWLAVRAIFIRMRRQYPNYRETRKRILLTGVYILIAYGILNVIMDFIHKDLLQIPHEQDVTDFDYTVATLTIIALASAIYESFFFYYQWKLSIIEKEQLRRENVESQLEGLKSQVNPHFLFNSLNTLTYIIPDDPDKAVKFVQKLSKVYRYILEIRDKKLISLEEEFDFLHSYLFLLKERFGDNLHIHLKVSDKIMHFQIVPLSLQILFENAIKHNIISKQKPLTIEVFEEKDKLVIKNNLQKKKQIMSSTKVGLQNIKNRYAYFSDEKVDIIETTDFFLVSLPLIKVPVTFI